jgi:hypothetical protein
MQASSSTYRNAVVDAALVLVDVSPGVAGGAKGRDEACGGLGNSVESAECHFDCTTKRR